MTASGETVWEYDYTGHVFRVERYAPEYSGFDGTPLDDDLTQIDLESPANGSVLSASPTFAWATDGGTNNVFAVDFSLSPAFTPYYSTYENMGALLHETSWTMPDAIWNSASPGTEVYWRVRGADLDVEPLNIIGSDEVWLFSKE